MGELCKQVEWSLFSAASTFSSFAGLAASLILASMVIIVVEYKGDENPSAAVALFTVTFLALGADTFIFGAVSGESLCARGDAQGMLGGSTMTTGAAILLLGITLLQAKFKHTHAGLALLGNVVTCMGAWGAMVLLSVWAVRMVNNLTTLRLRPPPMMSYAPALILAGIFLVAIVVIALLRPNARVRQVAIIVTMCVYLLHILISFGMYVATIVMPATQWSVHTDSRVLTLTLAIAIGFPLVELTGVVMALDWRSARLRQERRVVDDEAPGTVGLAAGDFRGDAAGVNDVAVWAGDGGLPGVGDQGKVAGGEDTARGAGERLDAGQEAG